MVKKECAWQYFNDEWNESVTDSDGGDEDFIDGVDFPREIDKDNVDFDGYEEYGS